MLLATAVCQIGMECDLAEVTYKQYERAVRYFSEWLGREAAAEDLTQDSLNGFIKFLQTRMRNTTANNYRLAICRVWNHLSEFESKPSYDIKRLRRPKPEEIIVTAWEMDEFEMILKGASEVIGRTRVTRIEGSALCTAMLWVEYNTAVRPGDRFRLRWNQIDFENKSISLIQHKTGKPHLTFLDEPAIDALRAIHSNDRDLIFPVTWSSTRKWMDKVYANAAAYGFKRVPGMNIGTLRKTNATEVFKAHGQMAAAESLGHVSGPQLVRKYYIDHRAARRYSVPPRPPSFDQRSS